MKKRKSSTPPTEAPPTLIDPPRIIHKKQSDKSAYTLTKFSYDTPLESPEQINATEPPFFLHERVIVWNGCPFQARSDCKYHSDFYATQNWIDEVNLFTREEQEARPLENEINILRNLFQEDLFAIVYFLAKNPLANHPFIVNACKEIQETNGDSLQVWARDHLKTTIISVCRSVQKIFNNREKRIAIFSATRPLAIKIQNMIKTIFEDPFVIRSFPDVLWENPYKDAPKWTESPEGGLIVKREGVYKEPTISSWGLIEGMPIGDHYTDIVCDDIVTQDTLSPEITEKVTENFEQLVNLGTRDCQTTIIGTYYRHNDALVAIRDRTDLVSSNKLFPENKKPATVDGTYNGKSVFLPEANLAKKRSGRKYVFYCQQLLDPTPRGQETLNPDHLVVVSKKQLPNTLYKFMIIDGAGDRQTRKRKDDAWALMVIGVWPYLDDKGMSDLYLLDLIIRPMSLADAQVEAVEMYSRNGRILVLGVEKVGMSTTEIHIANALKAKNRYVSEDLENLKILNPQKRSKEYRIESSISLPLRNGKIHLLDSLNPIYVQRLKTEMQRFPAWHDDGLDGLSYVYDIIKEYRFGAIPREKTEQESPYDRAFRLAREKNQKGGGWISV